MTPKELANQIESASLRAINALNKVIIATQDEAYGDVIIVLKKLELDSEGYILQNAANRATIRETNRVFSKSIDQSGYLEGLNRFNVTFSSIDKLNIEYFNDFPKFQPNKLFTRDLQKQIIADIESQLLNSGLESQVKIPLSQILNQNVNSGGSYSGMLDQVKDYIKGTDGEGKLLSYANTITKDLLFNYSRTYQQAVSSDLGLEFYLYVGGLIDTTRTFCSDRAGRYFHHKEIESWAGEDWKGKRSDTTESSIFIYAGGYNCLHQILPVSVAIVPQIDIDRAKELGFYKSAA
jgi:hypothetical protein